MKSFRIFAILFLAAVLPMSAQFEEEQTETPRVVLYLIPLLETAFSGELAWRPDWPADIPPDAFYLPAAEKKPLSITLSNNSEKINFTRDKEGRLVEFPFFMSMPQPIPQNDPVIQQDLGYSPEYSSAEQDSRSPVPAGYVKVEAGYAASGAIRSMSVTAETVWNIEFPVDFLPYSGISLGGAFPPIKVTRDDTVFFVFIFESPGFLTETWYDEDGNFLAFLKALVIRDKESWCIRSMQFQDMAAYYEEARFYDSGGNISEIQSRTEVFSAIYRDKRPEFWQRGAQRLQNFAFDLHWDMRGQLTRVKNIVKRPNLSPPAEEYRYEYEADASGNWIKRYEIPIISVLNLFAPQPPAVERVWNRKIVFLEN